MVLDAVFVESILTLNMSLFKYIDLYSGIGGFRYAIDKLGGESVGYSEIDKQALETYKENFRDPKHHDLGDVTKIKKLPKTDLIVGGVPCQSWSVAGKMKGFEDPRGKLWFDTIKMVKMARPKVFVFENVKGLADPRNNRNLQLILSEFKKIGYLTNYKVLNAYDFGSPQNRSRIFIVGFDKKYKEAFSKFQFPLPKQVTKRLGSYLEDIQLKTIMKKKFTANELFGGRVPASRNNFQKHDEVNDFFVFCDTRNGHSTIHSWEIKKTSKQQKEICMTILKNRRKKVYGKRDGNPISISDLTQLYPALNLKDINDLVEKSILKYTSDRKVDLVNSKNSAGIDGIYRIYLPNSHIFSTMTATGTKDFVALDYVEGETVEEYKMNFIKNILQKGRYRMVTPREAAAIQGFPRNFVSHPKNSYAYKQIGNSVAPPVVEALLQAIKDTRVFTH